jgi:uncharacterized membrane protein
VSFFGSLTFLSGPYLFGAAAALIPLLIHLSRSRRQKKIRFSTTRFFTDQFLRSYRMSRLREKILLACRMALFALFALALAQPFYSPKSGGAGGGAGGGSRAVVLVLDNSASMGFVDRGATLFDRARKAARTVLDGLKREDTASVVLAARRGADDGPEVLLPQPTGQLNDVRQALDRLEVTSLGTNLTAAVARAEAIASAAPADSREVYVLSDLQDSGWELRPPTAPTDPGRVSFVVAQVRPPRAVNRAVTAVQFASPRPMVGVPFSFRPVVSFANDDAAEARVRLYVDGDLVSERTVEKLPSGRWALPRFHHTFKAGGWHSGWVEVDDPNLPQDNRRYFALEVLNEVKVLAVDGAPSAVPHLSELFFLRLALTASPEGQNSAVDFNHKVTPNTLAVQELAKYQLVVLANVESLPPAAVERLEDYVAGGGSLLVFLGDKVNADFYNEALHGAARRNGGLLPARLLSVHSAAGGEPPPFVSAAQFRHPALAPFQDPRNGTLLGSGGIALKSFYKVDATPESVLLRASDAGASPLLCEQDYGKGRVMLFTSTCDRDWTNFPIRPVFLPWAHQLVAYLAQRPGTPGTFFEAGSLVPINPVGVDPAAPLLVRKPGGAVAAAERDTGGGSGFLFNETDRPGVYTALGPDAKQPAGMFVVNMDGHESDLTYLDDVAAAERPSLERIAAVEAELRDRLDRPVLTYIADPDKLAEAAAGAGRGRGLWDWFLVVVLILGLFEPWLANRISLRMYGRPRAAPEVALTLPQVAPRPTATEPAPAAPLEATTR